MPRPIRQLHGYLSLGTCGTQRRATAQLAPTRSLFQFQASSTAVAAAYPILNDVSDGREDDGAARHLFPKESLYEPPLTMHRDAMTYLDDDGPPFHHNALDYDDYDQSGAAVPAVTRRWRSVPIDPPPVAARHAQTTAHTGHLSDEESGATQEGEPLYGLDLSSSDNEGAATTSTAATTLSSHVRKRKRQEEIYHWTNHQRHHYSGRRATGNVSWVERAVLQLRMPAPAGRTMGCRKTPHERLGAGACTVADLVSLLSQAMERPSEREGERQSRSRVLQALLGYYAHPYGLIPGEGTAADLVK